MVIHSELKIDQLQVLFGPVSVQPDAAHHAHTRQPAAQVGIILCMRRQHKKGLELSPSERALVNHIFGNEGQPDMTFMGTLV